MKKLTILILVSMIGILAVGCSSAPESAKPTSGGTSKVPPGVDPKGSGAPAQAQQAEN